MSGSDKIILNQEILTIGENLIIQFIPEPENRIPAINPFSWIRIYKKILGEEKFCGSYAQMLIHLEDGTFQLIWPTYDWESGDYFIRVEERTPYYKLPLNVLWYEAKFELQQPDFDENDLLKEYMIDNLVIFEIFNAETKEPITIVHPGDPLMFAFNTSHPQVQGYMNQIIVLFSNNNYNNEEFYKIRPNHDLNINSEVIPSGEGILIQHFQFISPQPFINITGLCQAKISFQTQEAGELTWQEHILEFNIQDDNNYDLLKVESNPIKTFTVALFYYGSYYTDEDVENLRNTLQDYFQIASKNIFNLNVIIAGIVPLPEDVDHPYEDWWNSLPHDFTGSYLSYTNLSPDDEYYEVKLKFLWYYYGGKDPNIEPSLENIYEKGYYLIKKEIEENLYSFGTNNEDLLYILTDGGNSGIAVAFNNTHIVMTKPFDISVSIYRDSNDILNLADPNFYERTIEHIANVTFHEFAHLIWYPIHFHDFESVLYPFHGSNLFNIKDNAHKNLRKWYFLSYARDRDILEGMMYSDENLIRANLLFSNLRIIEVYPPRLVPYDTGVILFQGETPHQGINPLVVDDPNRIITIMFSNQMIPESVEQNFSISPQVTGTFTWENNNTILNFHPGPMTYNTKYTVTIGQNIQDITGGSLLAPCIWSFWTTNKINLFHWFLSFVNKIKRIFFPRKKRIPHSR